MIPDVRFRNDFREKHGDTKADCSIILEVGGKEVPKIV